MAIIFGDTSNSLFGNQQGGSQTLTGNDPTNTIFGDAGLNLLDKARGGDDSLLTHGAGSLFGDAGQNISNHAVGGDDALTAQIVTPTLDPINLTMFGDAGGETFPTTRSAVTTH